MRRKARASLRRGGNGYRSWVCWAARRLGMDSIPGDRLFRCGDEIVAAGQFFHTGTPGGPLDGSRRLRRLSLPAAFRARVRHARATGGPDRPEPLRHAPSSSQGRGRTCRWTAAGVSTKPAGSWTSS